MIIIYTYGCFSKARIRYFSIFFILEIYNFTLFFYLIKTTDGYKKLKNRIFSYINFSLILFLIPISASADIYKIFWPEENQRGNSGWDSVKIINVSSNTALDGTMSGVYTQDLTPLITAASAAASGGAYQLIHSLDSTGGNLPDVIDFSGTTIKFRASQAIALNPQGGSDPTYHYDMLYEVNVSTGAVIETRLVASDQAAATIADAAGFLVDLEASQLSRSGQSSAFQSYGTNATNEGTVNIQTKGGLVTEQLSNADGSSLLRKEDDGTVHIGQNSIVLSDELVSASGNDEIYSSSGVLQLGNNAAHKTVIKGTLEVPKPTAGAQAANKSYVDSMGAMMMAASQVHLNSDQTSKLNIGLGLGSMDGENAFAIGLGGLHQDTGVHYSFTATYSDFTEQAAFGAGVNWSLR